MNGRRKFVLTAVPAMAFFTSMRSAVAQPARVEESDPTAVALGYKHDATRVDAKKFASYQPGRVCANCQLYLAKGNDAWAPCPALGGKLVAAKGWCSAWVKKA